MGQIFRNMSSLGSKIDYHHTVYGRKHTHTHFLGSNLIMFYSDVHGSWLGGGFKYVLCSPLFGEDSHFDKYFSLGWNHQLVSNKSVSWFISPTYGDLQPTYTGIIIHLPSNPWTSHYVNPYDMSLMVEGADTQTLNVWSLFAYMYNLKKFKFCRKIMDHTLSVWDSCTM